MEFKNSFLARLFGTKEETVDETEETEELAAQPEEEPRQEGPPRHRLELPQGHALTKLWSVYMEQTGWQPAPELALEGPSDPFLPDAEAKTELLRLQMTVNASANERFEQHCFS